MASDASQNCSFSASLRKYKLRIPPLSDVSSFAKIRVSRVAALLENVSYTSTSLLCLIDTPESSLKLKSDRPQVLISSSTLPKRWTNPSTVINIRTW